MVYSRRLFAINIFPPVVVLLLFFACHSSSAQQFVNDLEDSVYADYWINLKIVHNAAAHSGSGYAIADPSFPFGLGFENRFPEAVRGVNTKLRIGGYVKSNSPGDGAMFVVTVIQGGVTVLWRSIVLSQILESGNTWYAFSENYSIPASVTAEGTCKVYLWNTDGRDTIALDNLEIDFEKLETHTFLPTISTGDEVDEMTPDTLLVTTDYYSIRYQPAERRIRIHSTTGDCLVKNILYFTQAGREGKMAQKMSRFTLLSVSREGDEVLISGEADQAVLQIRCTEDSPKITFTLKESFPDDVLVHRTALVLQSAQEPKTVYRANRKTVHADLQEEYWLDRQGVQFGSSANAWLIYHTPEVSSMQLRTGDAALWINLDYAGDHPFLHFPLLDEAKDVKVDRSSSHYPDGGTKTTSFSIQAGRVPHVLPRLMRHPHGYLATFIWTEHADFTDIRTHRATYFGSEDIRRPKKATGGFVKYNIPVTKSVFYKNPEKIQNPEAPAGRIGGFETAIKNEQAYFRLLKRLARQDHEICLHTPEHFTSNEKMLDRSMQFMQKKFGAKTWIDHGYNNGAENNREDLACDGVNPESPAYALKYWNEYGVRYFWNPYYEDYYTFDTLQFGEMLSKPYPGFGDHIPDPDYWMHPTRTGSLVHWPTKNVHFVASDAMWDFLFNEVVLNDFTAGWNVQFNHCYPAWVDPEKGFWYFDDGGKVAAREGFNRTLQRMAALRDSGWLNLTTIGDYLDYRLAIEKIEYSYLGDGRIEITNAAGQDIRGLSFAVKKCNLQVDGAAPDQKSVENDIVFWLDIEAGDSKMIELSDQP